MLFELDLRRDDVEQTDTISTMPRSETEFAEFSVSVGRPSTIIDEWFDATIVVLDGRSLLVRSRPFVVVIAVTVDRIHKIDIDHYRMRPSSDKSMGSC